MAGATALNDAELPSPCVSVCKMDAAGSLCTGCFRTLDEIGAWSRMAGPAKRAVWALIAQRAQSVDTR
jgi:uncharacterized protein